MENSSQPASISQSLRIAMEHFQAGRLSEAKAAYAQILREAPDHPDALHFLGIIAHQSGQGGAAVDLINKAIRAKPSAPMYCNLGIVLQAQGKLDAAIENYRKAISLRPDHAELYCYLGDTLKAQGNLEAAVTNYSKAIELRPDYVGAYVSLGNTFHHLNRLSEAETCYRRALDLPDTGGVSRSDLLDEYAMVLFKLGRYDDAAREIKKALQLKPESPLINQHYRATLAKLIPSWHFSMLADDDRNAAFRKAIDKHCAGVGLVLRLEPDRVCLP
jgi:protein O-GlcNAc transferase